MAVEEQQLARDSSPAVRLQQPLRLTHACLAGCIAIFFISYCIMDLVIGWFEYEQEIDYTDGW